MKDVKKRSVKILSLILCAVMIFSLVGAISYAAGAKTRSTAEKETAGTEASGGEKEQETTEGDVSKDETVYVIANADGSPRKIIVSDWIKNSIGKAQVNDSSELDNVTNVNGEESCTVNDGGMRVWDAEGNDIYYKGDIRKELPVTMSISYKLDGKSISAEELAGKSGKVTMRFDYTNNQYEEVEIEGEKQKIYVPFVMLTGMILDNEQFKNVEVSNGRLVNDGSHTIVAGIAMPGLQENLNIDKEKLELPDHVEITADVTDFEVAATLSLATNEVFGDIDLEDGDSIDKLKESLDKLSDAMEQLLDGSSALYDGLETLQSKSGELIDGVSQLASGAGALSDGAGALKNGTQSLKDGAGDLAGGLNKLAANNETLNGGARQVFDSLLAAADSQLAAAGLSVPALTIDNYAEVLDGVKGSLDENTVYNMAYNTALDAVTGKVRAQETAIRAQVEVAVRGKVLEGVLQAAGMPMTAEQYEAAVNAGGVDADTQAMVAGAVDNQMQSSDIQGQIAAVTESKVQELIQQNMQSSEVTSQINAAVESARNGAGSIAALKAQLDSYHEFYNGLLSYTAGVAEANEGAGALLGGASDLAAGASDLYDGAGTLREGIGRLQSGGGALTDGVSQLADGAMQLSDGLKEFSEEGVQKLVDAVDGDLDVLVSRLRATADVSKNYRSFAGISGDMSGSVKFIYKTDAVETEE